MSSLQENILAAATDLKALFGELLFGHSGLRKMRTDAGMVQMVTARPYKWTALGPDGQQLQSRLLEEYCRFFAILKTLMAGAAEDTLKRLTQLDEKIRDCAEQSRGYVRGSIDDALRETCEALEEQASLIERLYDYGGGGVVYLVPDTNALYFNPGLAC